MKGIILAGGSGTRLYPATKVVCKQLLPIYDKPMIYYPLSVLMLAGIREVLIISTPQDISRFQDLLGNGDKLGMTFSYIVQEQPNGLAEAFILGESFIQNEPCALVLGDNIFYGSKLAQVVQNARKNIEGATVFGYQVKDPQRYGVVEFDSQGHVISIEEKPDRPKSNFAVVGLYFYDHQVVQMAKSLKPSKRGELEITDLNNLYLQKNALKVQLFDRGYAWLDTGTHDSMADATLFIKAIEDRQGLKIGCIEEIAWRMNFIDNQQLTVLAEELLKSGYGQYLYDLLK
ncbi:MAG TPA: glucose-1-phosphate thymidylyltransferase RfbA [Candidatus Cloacimonadota bacterium]|nr:glucose-1-phosphate thymidylyltransferase RfbA [Candidatus Cloacimonadota bacterium]HOD54221.1 glucose-1-phosphate thymidylyltransferase RfbA [Candidatus Cloacimonadota bacterium]HPM02187.1 glucose-1-phosphate thymidylyltransferase RfbA [Candidatus Cloacimonadota bacterium]